jgi:hypothetical protein
MKLRQQKGALSDSMATVVEIEPKFEALAAEVNKNLSFWYDKEFNLKGEDIKIEPYKYDPRINWDTHIVLCRDNGITYSVYGFTDGPLES